MPDGGVPAHRCFALLLRHFFSRFFESDELSADADGTANLGPILGVLAVPGAFLGILLQSVTLSGWGLVTFRYWFVAFSMIVTGLITVYKWDSLFPDRQDYQILTPLPLKPSSVFFAKISALALLLGMFLLDINLLSVLFWPGIDTRTPVTGVFIAHLAAVGAAGLFIALTLATVQGILITVLGASLFRRVSTVLQAFLIGALVMLLFLTPSLAEHVRHLAGSKPWILYCVPSFWFLGIYERLRPATADPVLLASGVIGLRALAASTAAFVLVYLPAYRRHARKMLEMDSARRGDRGRMSRVAGDALGRLVLRRPVQRAVFHFISHTITRSTTHRLFLATYGGFGAALALITFAGGDSGLLRLPLTLSFVLVSGLRAAFNFPSELAANWAFRLTETGTAAEYLSAVRKWILLYAVLPLFAVLLPVELIWFPPMLALFHTAYGITLAVLLIETMFLGFRKVPFTCAYFPGKSNLIGLGLIYILGFTTYSEKMALLEEWLARTSWAAVPFFAAAAVAWMFLARWRKRDLAAEPDLDYDGGGGPLVRTIGLEQP